MADLDRDGDELVDEDKSLAPRAEFPAPAPVIIAGRKTSSKIGSPISKGPHSSLPESSTIPAARESSGSQAEEDTASPDPGQVGDGIPDTPSLPPPASRGEKSQKAPAGGRGEGGSVAYKPPSWGAASPPENTGLSLTVLKSGLEVGSVSLDNRTYLLLGRQQGVVDVLLEHPSISRRHAILQHGQKGSLFLLDNGSTHGCKVNKAKIPPKEFHRLHVGDVIKFGESTRLYVLEGPDDLRPAEYESDNLRSKRLEASKKQLAAKLAKIKAGSVGGQGAQGDSGEYGISWGFDEDAVNEDDEDEDGTDGAEGEVELPDYLKTEAQKRRRHDTRSDLTEENVHQRDAKLFEKLQLKLTKVEHLLTENERITAKEGAQGGLSEGQQAQLVRNDKAIAAVRLQVEEIEETIRSKNKARENSKGDKENGTADGRSGEGDRARDEDDEDDFYDRTAPVLPASARMAAGGAASKKAEVRARRFGAKDKTRKLASPTEGIRAGTGSIYPNAGGADSAALSLEALTRKVDLVAEDLARTEAGLAELEEEEAQERDDGGDEQAVADPLDKFMASNRNKERLQAVARLTAQRESLRQEQEQLHFMVEAARPSLPTLKTPKPDSVEEAEGGSHGARGLVPSPDARRALSADATDAAESVARAAKGGDERANVDAQSENRDFRDEGGDGKTEKSFSNSRTMSSPRPPTLSSPAPRLPSPPSPQSAVAHAERRPRPADKTTAAKRDGQQAAIERAEDDRRPSSAAGTSLGSQDVTPSSKDAPNANALVRKGNRGDPAADDAAVGAKRRRATIPAAMLPPPPAKRPQRREKDTAARESNGAAQVVDAEGAPRRKVKGPAAMPPPAGKPSTDLAAKSTDEGEGKGEGARADIASAGHGVLEGGDADWVPPKDQIGDGRTALNLKFGY